MTCEIQTALGPVRSDQLGTVLMHEHLFVHDFEMNINYRFAPDRTIDEAIDHLRAVCIDADTFTITDVAAPGLVELGHPVFESLAAASAAEVTGKQGWTDVAQLSQAGVPAVNFGPGETSLAHKPGESVRISDLGWAYDALLAVLA